MLNIKLIPSIANIIGWSWLTQGMPMLLIPAIQLISMNRAVILRLTMQTHLSRVRHL